MTESEGGRMQFEEDDHRVCNSTHISYCMHFLLGAHQLPPQAAFVFSNLRAEDAAAKHSSRPAKRRKVARPDAPKPQAVAEAETSFPPLFNGAESPDAVRLRKELFETSWPIVEDGIQVSVVLPTPWFVCFGHQLTQYAACSEGSKSDHARRGHVLSATGCRGQDVSATP
jgi:hypothetical protein